MNIFLLDTNLTKCAQYHCDKHVVKMPVEYAQLLSSVLLSMGLDAPYKKTHENHPCAKWARLHNGNYTMLYDLAVEVGKEYTYRYGKIHKSTQVLNDMPRLIGNKMLEHSPLPNCTKIKGYYPHLNLVDIYRLFYMRDKAHILNFKNREEPPWMGERFYRQQLKAIGTCPGDGKDVKPKRLTKEESLKDFKINGLEKLLAKDIAKILELKEFPKLDVPNGRLKAPYIAELSKIHAEVNWTKLTVKDALTVIESVNNV